MKLSMKPSNFCMMFTVVLLFLILVNIVFSYTSSPRPYTPDSVFAHQYSYSTEGFETAGDVANSYPTASSVNNISNPPAGLTGRAGGSSSTGSAGSPPPPPPPPSNHTEGLTGFAGPAGLTGHAPPPAGLTGSAPVVPANGSGTPSFFGNLMSSVFGGAGGNSTSGFSNKEGFSNILSAGSADNENNLMYLANTQSNLSCSSTSLGLSNSRGYLCLSPDQIDFLKSRGGNATSKGEF